MLALAAAADGSTLRSTWIDQSGDGRLRVGPGEALVDRLELGDPQRPLYELARLVHLTDAHVMDASSPARVPFLARLGPPVQSTFRPQETLTAQVLHGAINAVRAFHPDLVIQGGDLIDNDQSNELEHALALLNGGRVHPGSGPRGYYGVQLPSDPDPSYYRPDIDAPRHPGMLGRQSRPFTSPGIGSAWLPVLGDHDALVAGELVPSQPPRALPRRPGTVERAGEPAAARRSAAERRRFARRTAGSRLRGLLHRAGACRADCAGAARQAPLPARVPEVIGRLWAGSDAAAEPATERLHERIRAAGLRTGRRRIAAADRARPGAT